MGRRLITAALIIAAVAFLSPSPAEAARAYGAFEFERHLLTLTLNDAATRLQTLGMRVKTDCGENRVLEFTYPMIIAARAPASTPTLYAAAWRLPSPRGVLRYAIATEWADAKITGTLTLSRIRVRTASTRLAMEIVIDNGLVCRLRTTLQAIRRPGELYVGTTDDSEPVWLRRQGRVRRQDRDSIEWFSGFGVPCSPTGFMEGIHANVLVIRRGNRFGGPALVGGYSFRGYAQQVQLSGRIIGPRAEGRYRITGSGGPDDALLCDTGPRTWSAIST